MSANRPVRKVRAFKDKAVYDRNQWQVLELRRMQKALLKISPQEPDKLTKAVISKSTKEVRAFLEHMRKTLQKEYDEKQKDPITLWTTLASDLISCEIKDYSEVLAEVMAVAGHFECTEPVSSSSENILSSSGDEEEESLKHRKNPDYSSIYKYLAAILAGEDLPTLGKLECSIVVDLLQGLTDTIKTHDSSKQQQIMLWKYHLLNSKIDISDTMKHVDRCRKAVNNDFSDFKAASGSTNMPSTSGTHAKPSSLETTSTEKKTTLGKRHFATQQTKSVKKSRTKETDSNIESQTNEKFRSESDKTGAQHTNTCDSAASKRRASKASGHISSTSGSKNGEEYQRTAGAEKQPKLSQKTQEKTEQTEKEQVGNKNRKENIPKKPALFTLNPFCIPIDLLKFQPLVSSKVVFNPVKKPGNNQRPHIIKPSYIKKQSDAVGQQETIIVSRSPAMYK